MKFIYLADTHIKGKNPENRIGNYYQDVMTKVKEVIKLSKKLKVNYVIHGGDVFNSPYVSTIIIDEFIDLIEAAKIPWYIIWGNHDCIGHDPKLSKASALAHIFRRSKLIKPLDILSDCDTSIIEGFDYYHAIENDIKEKGLTLKPLKNTDIELKDIKVISNSDLKKTLNNFKGLKIAITHAFITLKPFLPHVLHIQMKDIKTDFDIVLCSHYHKDWGIKEMNGTKFVNLGAIGRQGIDEVNRIPKVLLVDTETKNLEIIPLKSAKKGEEVFNLEKIEKIKQFEGNIDTFIRSLESTKFQGLDLRGMVESVGKEKEENKKVINELIKRIGRFEDEK